MKRIFFWIILITGIFGYSSEILNQSNLFTVKGTQILKIDRDFSGIEWGTSVSSNVSPSAFCKIQKLDESVLISSENCQSNWNIRQKDVLKIKFEDKKIFRIFVTARKLGSGNGSLVFALSGMKNGKKASDRVAVVPNIESSDFTTYTTYFISDSDLYDEYYLRFIGRYNGQWEVNSILIDSVDGVFESAVVRNEEVFENGHFKGVLGERIKEKNSRAVNCIKTPDNAQLISWRLLDSDTTDTCFTVEKNGKLLTKKPVKNSTNFLDEYGMASDVYTVRAFSDSSMKNETGFWTINANVAGYKSIKPRKNMVARGGCAVGDLDGDGEYDYVLKTGIEANIDPSENSGWHPSKGTFSFEAYTHDGKFLWEKDLGWNIECGIWYSPYVVADLDGDGKCEVIAKTGEYTGEGGKDYRDSTGRVRSGPQYLSVFDGMTGKEICKTDWVDWTAYENESYAHSVRNQIAIAYLDGKTPCIVMLSGTYGHQEVKTFFMKDNKLVPIWRYNNAFLESKFQGQGAHWTVCADIDEDGRDEIIIGSICFDDNGEVLWNLGRGHPDAVYFGDLDPKHEGKELAFFFETKQNRGGILMTDLNGKELWALEESTSHIHSQALCSDVDPSYPGRELYGMNSGSNHSKTSQKWLFSSDGKILKTGDEIPSEWGFAPEVAYFTDSKNSSLFKTRKFKERSKFRYEGQIIYCADIEGDWREEIITSEPKSGELRIYSAIDVSKHRRPMLMQEKFYHSVVTNNSSGYAQHPELPDGMSF